MGIRNVIVYSYSRYIEEELSNRKNKKLQEGGGGDMDNDDTDEKYLSPEEAALLSLPEHLRVSSTHRSEEMLSNQMLNGIPEVDLGIDAKIRNIEATEAAKEKLLQDQKNKKSAPSHFVPTNMAVNFVQHNRCTFIPSLDHYYCLCLFELKKKMYGISFAVNIDDAEARRRKQRQQEERERNANGGQKPTVKRATDDYHYDKFKKQFRRY